MTAYDPSERSAPAHPAGPPVSWPPSAEFAARPPEPEPAHGSWAGATGSWSAEREIPTNQWQSPTGEPGGVPAAWLDSPVAPGGAHASRDRPGGWSSDDNWGADPARAAYASSASAAVASTGYREPVPAQHVHREVGVHAAPAAEPAPWAPPGAGQPGEDGRPARRSPKMALVAALVAAALAGAGVGAGVTAALSGDSSSSVPAGGAPGQGGGAPGQNGQAPTGTQPSAAATGT
ncbi:hypothetical protein [Actinoplanes awajinensis]|uniref:Uncharacterized protein n=1 Tax=Actinoplanes awajinensis subsp. mycoplanecinus TaxID=135947 RepID=A0A101JSZ9_9ACTN|nr:hypothetical protein [Actinoplanes awajinensis]KUL32404.1 hypothetical protein ADL15_20530 [Actinoplanes awajinensis subsp. mycoplanecinus]